MGSIEKVDEVLTAGNPGAALTVVFTLTFPDGVSFVFVRMRTFPPKMRLPCAVSLPESRML